MPATEMFGGRAVFLHSLISHMEGERSFNFWGKHCPSTLRPEGINASRLKGCAWESKRANLVLQHRQDI